MAVLMKDAPPEAVDMVIKLMDFNPEKRLDIEAALKHPYMVDFVTGSEPSCPGKCVSASRPILALLACLPPACLPAQLCLAAAQLCLAAAGEFDLLPGAAPADFNGLDKQSSAKAPCVRRHVTRS